MEFKKRKIFLLAAVLASAAVHAGFGVFGRGNNVVHCESLLTPDYKKQATEGLRSQLFSRIFSFDLFHETEEAAKKKLGVLGTFDEPQLDNVILVVESARGDIDEIKIHLYKSNNGEFLPVLQGPLPDKNPLLFHFLRLTDAELEFAHQILSKVHPMPRYLDFKEVGIEYVADPDEDGVRQFLGVSSGNHKVFVSIGIDVPCAKAELYTKEMPARDLLRVKGLKSDYCRIPVWIFSRVEL